MAKDLGVSKYVLSRLFSKIFHRNFNQYLNDARLNYACHRLENTSILLQIFAWIVDLKVRGHLTGYLKKDIKFRQVTIEVHVCEGYVVIKGSAR